MKNINKDMIAKKTKEKIGYYNYLEESKKIGKRNKKILFVTCSIFIFCICTVTVNASTNNALLKLGKNIIKVNGKDTEAEIYEELPKVVYSRCIDDYVVTDANKCIQYYPYKDKKENAATICYPLATEFESIEIFYDKNKHYCGVHITGISNEGHFEDYLKDCN